MNTKNEDLRNFQSHVCRTSESAEAMMVFSKYDEMMELLNK